MGIFMDFRTFFHAEISRVPLDAVITLAGAMRASARCHAHLLHHFCLSLIVAYLSLIVICRDMNAQHENLSVIP